MSGSAQIFLTDYSEDEEKFSMYEWIFFLGTYRKTG